MERGVSWLFANHSEILNFFHPHGKNQPSVNEFNGRRTVQLKVLDWRAGNKFLTNPPPTAKFLRQITEAVRKSPFQCG